MQPMQPLCAQCEYQQIAHATYVGAMCTMWVPTNCPNNLCRPYVHNVGTNELPMQPMQALCAQCEYQQIAHATYVDPMCTMWVPTNCPSNLCRLYVHNVSTNKLPMQAMQVLCAKCEYQQIVHATYVGPMFIMWVPTNCPCNLCRPYVQNVSTNKLSMQPMQALCAQCGYQQIAHATYVGSMCTMWVPTNCPCKPCRPYVHNVGTNKLPMQPMQPLCSQCGYQQIAHATYVAPMFTMWVPTNCPCNLCRPYVHNVSTNKLPMQPMQALCAQCEYQQIAHATYVGPMCTMWVTTNCPSNLCRLYVHNVGTNKLPMQAMQVLCAQCEYQQIVHATYLGSMCTMWIPTNCPSNLCSPYVHNVGTNKLPMQPMQALCAQCEYQQIAHATYVAPMFTMWVPTNCPCNLCSPYVHNVSTNKLPMQPMQALCAQCGYQQIAQTTYVGPMFTMWVPTNCPCNLCRPYVHNVSTNKLPMQPMQTLCAQCEYRQIAQATYVGSMCTM